MEWEPNVYDFLNAFRTYGFQDSKRSMSTKSKLEVAPKGKKKAGAKTLPFPTLNMQYVLMYFVLCLRARFVGARGDWFGVWDVSG